MRVNTKIIERIVQSVWPYGLMVWLFLLTTWLKLSVPNLGTDSPFLMYFFVIGVTALAAGIRAGLVATAVAVILTHALFLQPDNVTIVTAVDTLKLSLFTVEAVLLTWIVERERQAKGRLSKSVKELEATKARLVDTTERATHLLAEVLDKGSTGSRRR